MRQTEYMYLVFNPVMVEGYAALFSSGLRLNDGFDVKLLNGWLKLDDCLWPDPPWFN